MCSFYEIKTFDNEYDNSPASFKIRTKSHTLNYTSLTFCQTKTHSNIGVVSEQNQMSYTNNSYNKIPHITFTYIIDIQQGEISFCNIFHNPSNIGVEIQTSNCKKSVIHQSIFVGNKCIQSSENHLGVIRLCIRGYLEADEIYFFQNDALPLSFDDNSGHDDIGMTVGTVYTDNQNFYSVVPSKIESINADPPFYTAQRRVNKCRLGASKRFRGGICVLPLLSFIYIKNYN